MIALIQRVDEAGVVVDGERIASIARGVLALVAVEPGDAEPEVERMLGLLLVPQFTLAADTRKGMRASFTSAAPPELGRRLFDLLAARARECHPVVETGRFGAH